MTTNSIQTVQDTDFESTFRVHPVIVLLRWIASAYVAAYEPRTADGQVVDVSRVLRVPPTA